MGVDLCFENVLPTMICAYVLNVGKRILFHAHYWIDDCFGISTQLNTIIHLGSGDYRGIPLAMCHGLIIIPSTCIFQVHIQLSASMNMESFFLFFFCFFIQTFMYKLFTSSYMFSLQCIHTTYSIHLIFRI